MKEERSVAAEQDGVVEERRDVALHQVQQGGGQLRGCQRLDLGAQPKVDEDEAALVVDEEVAGMRVRVEEAHVEQLREEARHASGDEPVDHIGR